MKKLIILALLAAFVLPGMASPVLAKDNKGAGMNKSTPVDVGNKLCPVEGAPVSGQDFVTYKGKRYALCGSMCEGTFRSEPEKYISAMKEREPNLASK